jgi:H-NS histone family
MLAAAGLSLKDLIGNGHKKAAKGIIYHTGHVYQHPADKTLLWNGKGKKPNWPVAFEADGKAPVESAKV